MSKTEQYINDVFDRMRQIEAEMIDTRVFWFGIAFVIARML